ncbi:hypothetical protein [Falsirhodobacter algicola]|uniref:Uncharacterized protein n=1 Tax=Falsirhodobacter algicola TaxID=2692330 RepID=A0A8J8MUD0_9RHOB|nr:hypothetical protein [Falsirhodobacter algicola]QUS36669.1 hypothetical protein GR316_10580 [Falsirhodobacter algicola]
MQHPSFSFIARTVTLVLLAYLVVSAALVPDIELFFHEGAGVEQASLGLLLFGIGAWFLLAGEARWREWQIPAAMALMLAREMDFDKRFTDHGLLKLTTYTHAAPTSTRIIGAIAIAFTLWTGMRILRRNLPLWWARLRMAEVDAWLVLGAFVCGVAAKTLDGLGRKLADFGIIIQHETNALAGKGEEVLEALCYYLIVLAVARLAVPAVRRAAGLEPVAAE